MDKRMILQGRPQRLGSKRSSRIDLERIGGGMNFFHFRCGQAGYDREENVWGVRGPGIR
jgi:hypothetical protein